MTPHEYILQCVSAWVVWRMKHTHTYVHMCHPVAHGNQLGWMKGYRARHGYRRLLLLRHRLAARVPAAHPEGVVAPPPAPQPCEIVIRATCILLHRVCMAPATELGRPTEQGRGVCISGRSPVPPLCAGWRAARLPLAADTGVPISTHTIITLCFVWRCCD
jgi:hypothetical protein